MELKYNQGVMHTEIILNNREMVIFGLLCDSLITEEKMWEIIPSYCEEELVDDILAFGTEISTRIPDHSRKHIFCAPSGD